MIDYCRRFKGNKYLFHTKNSKRLKDFRFDKNMAVGVTIESNRYYPKYMGKAPKPAERAYHMNPDNRNALSKLLLPNWKAEDDPDMPKRVVTIEPILDFDLKEFVDMILPINPDIVAIGADSKSHGMKEPSAEKIQALIAELKNNGIKVLQKDNLKRLLNKNIKN